MFPQPSSGDVEISGTTIHSTIPYVPRLRVEGPHGCVEAGNVGARGRESPVYLAGPRPRQQRGDETETLIIQDVSFYTPQIISGFRQDRLELRSTEHRLLRGRVLQAVLQEAEAPRVDAMFEDCPQEIPVALAPGSHQDPRDRTLWLVCRLLNQRFFFSGRAVEHE